MINTKTILVLSLIAAAVVTIVGISQTSTITAQTTPTGNAMYIFGEGVYPQATFTFRDATVTYEFQLFETVNNLFGGATSSAAFSGRQAGPEFTLIRVVGETPYLHEAVDQTYTYNGRASGFDYPYKEFDVKVEMIQAGQSIRTIEYADCSITNYKINTRADNEEGYTSGGRAGFAVVETYTFACAGYDPQSPLYDMMIEEQQNRKPYQ
jgi:hypothetical protein